MKIAIATCLTIPEVDADEALTLDAFRQRGHETEMVAWDDPTSRFEDYDAVIVRSTWNYPDLIHEFEPWIRETGNKVPILNPADIMLANLNKRYLVDMAANGIPTVASEWIWPADADQLKDIFHSKCVLKPTIGVGSMDTRVFEANEVDEAITWLSEQNHEREFIIQPFMESVQTVGEQSIVMIGGEPSHRILKHPRFADGHEKVEGPFPVDGEFDEIARRIVEPIKDRILYARVDLMQNERGKWVLSELELIEPSLFFRQKPDALEQFLVRAEKLLA